MFFLILLLGGYDSGIVVDPARSYLNDHYDPHREHGYCVTHWFVRNDTIVVDQVQESTAQFESAEYAASFLCPTGQPIAHTHPPTKPLPSPQDQQTGLIDLRLPFIFVQSGYDTFSFWIVWSRVHAES